MYMKRRQENEGVKFTFFALLTGDVSDSFFTTVNLILLKAGSY